MKILGIFFFLVISYGNHYANATEESCSTERVSKGNCELIANCKRLERELKTLSIAEFVRVYGGCGNDPTGNLRICCPVDVIPDDPTCPSLARRVPGLGCVTAVTERLSWSEARDNCRRIGSRLLQGITTESQLQLLKSGFEGLFDFKNEYHDVWLGLYESQWLEGSSSSLVPQEFWYPGQPQGGPYKCGYVSLQMDTPTLWETMCPNSALPSFCHSGYDFDVDIRVPPVSSGSSCAPPWQTIEGLGCVRPITQKMTWTRARDNCVRLGGRLLSGLTTEEHLQQLKTHFSGIFQHVTGLYQDVWLGLYQGEWISEKGVKPPSSFWYPGQPKGGQFECGYIALQMETPTLWDTVCSEASLPSLCQISAN